LINLLCFTRMFQRLSINSMLVRFPQAVRTTKTAIILKII